MRETYDSMFIEMDYGKIIKLDLKDKKIIAALAQNSRISPTNLSKVVGLSKDGVLYRIKKLKREKVLRKNALIINPYYFIVPYTILLRLEGVEETDEQKLLEYFYRHPLVAWFCQCSDAWDIIVNIFAKDVKHFSYLLREIKARCGNSLKDYEIIPITATLQYNSMPNSFAKEIGIKLEFDRSDVSFGKFIKKLKIGLSENKIHIDSYDIKILEILSEDSSKQISSIGKIIKLSPNSVKYRIKKLIDKKVILAFKSIFNVSYLRYHGFALFISLNPNVSNEQRKNLENFFAYHDEVAFAFETTGRCDFEVYMFAKDVVHFHKLLSEIRNKFSSIINNQFSLLILKDYKFNFFPNI